jgi:nucleotide-binding universal stress UspA family protein
VITPTRIVVGVDFSEATDRVLAGAMTVARGFGATIDLVHVRPTFEYPLTGGFAPLDGGSPTAVVDFIDRSLARLAGQLLDQGITCITTSLDGGPATELVSHAKKVGADLIVVGTHGRGGIAHAVLGSVAERVVQKAHRPVLVIPVAAT